MSVFFISDLHLGHENMTIKRGFSCADEMNEYIIKSWNSVIDKIDMKKKSNYGKSRKWQKVKEDEVDLFAYEVMYFVDKNSILNCFIFYCGKLVVHL